MTSLAYRRSMGVVFILAIVSVCFQGPIGLVLSIAALVLSVTITLIRNREAGE